MIIGILAAGIAAAFLSCGLALALGFGLLGAVLAYIAGGVMGITLFLVAMGFRPATGLAPAS